MPLEQARETVAKDEVSEEDLKLEPMPKRALTGPPAVREGEAQVSKRALLRALRELRRYCVDCEDGVRADMLRTWTECKCGAALGRPEVPRYGKRGRRDPKADAALSLLKKHEEQQQENDLEQQKHFEDSSICSMTIWHRICSTTFNSRWI